MEDLLFNYKSNKIELNKLDRKLYELEHYEAQAGTSDMTGKIYR